MGYIYLSICAFLIEKKGPRFGSWEDVLLFMHLFIYLATPAAYGGIPGPGIKPMPLQQSEP